MFSNAKGKTNNCDFSCVARINFIKCKIEEEKFI